MDETGPWKPRDLAGAFAAECSAAREPLAAPTEEQMAAYAVRQRLSRSPRDVVEGMEGVDQILDSARRLQQLSYRALPVRYPDRQPGWVASRREDPDNAIVRYCEVKGAPNGPLSGMNVGIKDNIAVAGIPMTDGTRGTPPFVPAEDAVVVERLLDAGATVVAKTNLVPSDFGPTRNPRDPRFSAGGSSSGSAAAVAGGIADLGLGADQGGSVRIPAAWCGIVGMKATHGLVPTYGLTYWDHTLDHIGPLTNTVADNAAMLTALAGRDWRDPQWVRADPVGMAYGRDADLGIRDLRIGVITESLEPAGCDRAALTAFETACRRLADAGAEVVPVRIPLWCYAKDIWLATVTFGLPAMANTFGQGHGHLGRIDVSRVVANACARRQSSPALPFGGHALPLAYEHLREHYSGLHFGLAQNLRLDLRLQVDNVLADFDLLITPTSPTGPTRINARPGGRIFPEWIVNTCPLNLTGHPALTVPSGCDEDGMPAGLQIIGRRFDEYTVYRAGFAFEGAKGN